MVPQCSMVVQRTCIVEPVRRSGMASTSIAFEEFSTEKRHRTTAGVKSRQYDGRQDLSIEIGRYEFVCEAKICWSGMTRANMQPHLHINAVLDKACSDVCKTRFYGEWQLGMVFARPYIRATKRVVMEERIHGWLKEIRNVEYSCCSWVFPSKGRDARDGQDLLPGVAIFIREV
jgi:hypothetical protein